MPLYAHDSYVIACNISSFSLPHLRQATLYHNICRSVANEAKKISSETIHQQIGRQALQTMQYRAVITYVPHRNSLRRIRRMLSFRAHSNARFLDLICGTNTSFFFHPQSFVCLSVWFFTVHNFAIFFFFARFCYVWYGIVYSNGYSCFYINIYVFDNVWVCADTKKKCISIITIMVFMYLRKYLR